MSAVARMHEGEVIPQVGLVRLLLVEQFPAWAELPLRRVPSDGTDNALYRLGDDMVVRLPRIDWAVAARELEHEWLPRLAPLLPVTIPTPFALGAPTARYPWPWSVYEWIEGENPAAGSSAGTLARELARFVTALRRIDAAGAPAASRGVPLATLDGATRAAIASLRDVIDTDAATVAWERALQAPPWTGPPVWFHGDLMPGNLLVRDGRLAAVIDFGAMGAGDPACDLMPAWNLFSARARKTFRAELEVDDGDWERGRGWALATGLIALPYYIETNPGLAANARYRIGEVLSEVTP